MKRHRRKIVKVKRATLERHRNMWAPHAKRGGWYRWPFYLQFFVDMRTGEVLDSCSTAYTRDMFTNANGHRVIQVEVI